MAVRTLLEPARNLHRRPLPLQLGGNEFGQYPVLAQFADLGATAFIPGTLIRLVRSIMVASTVAPDLPANRGRGTTKPLGDGPQ